MDISELTLKLIILLIPGAIAALLFDALTTHKAWTPFKFIVNSILMGILAYLMLQGLRWTGAFVHNCFCHNKIKPEPMMIWDSVSDSKKPIPLGEVFYSSLLGLMVGGLATFSYAYKFFNWLAKRVGISNKYGDENLYSYFLNGPNTNFVYVRNIKTNITYHGLVKSFSETDTISELVLNKVSVYDYTTNKFCYDIAEIYLSFAKTDVVIELANTIEPNGEKSTSPASK